MLVPEEVPVLVIRVGSVCIGNGGTVIITGNPVRGGIDAPCVQIADVVAANIAVIAEAVVRCMQAPLNRVATVGGA